MSSYNRKEIISFLIIIAGIYYSHGNSYGDNIESDEYDEGIKEGYHDTYSWKEFGFTNCSAPCLGGVQNLIINCVRDFDQKVVSPFLCPAESLPESIIRTCNDRPCTPQWNYSDFQACSKPCGLGIQMRQVFCIHQIGRGGKPILVPNSMCPQPPPSDRQYCNVLDCPARWHISEWSKCSKSCGVGYKTRKAECMQVMAQSHRVSRPASMCIAVKPPERKPCNTKPCQEIDSPIITITNQSYVQLRPKKKVTLKIGGSAIIFWGTTLKIKCPVKRFHKNKILWAKDHKYISSSKKYKISKKGALRIDNVMYSDTGVYTCVAGRSSADFTLTVKPRPEDFPAADEIEAHTG